VSSERRDVKAVLASTIKMKDVKDDVDRKEEDVDEVL